MPGKVSQTLFIRLDPKDKQALLKAAEEAGQSLSQFVLEAALRKAGALKEEEAPSGTSFSWKQEIEAAVIPGGPGYQSLGRVLGRNLRSALGQKIDANEIDAYMEKIEIALSRGHLNQVWAFLNSTFPEALARIPSRRRPDFLRGLSVAFDRDELF